MGEMNRGINFSILKIWAITAFCLLTFTGFSQNKYPQNYFRSPLNVPLVLSGTFGELRSNHFHSGIDIKTQQKTGLPVLAVADGYVSRIKVSPYGFGKAIYVTHPNGYTSVYAHLQKFAPQIQAFVRKAQYQQQSFAVELFPSSSQFKLLQGGVLAFSGNTGGSGGPHLHFEIRDSKTEKVINPLHFGFKVKDTRRPNLFNLMVYQFNGEELVSSEPKKILTNSTGKSYLAGNEVLDINYQPAFGIQTTDKQDGASNNNGVYSIDMWMGEEKVYRFCTETFAFGETRYINSHIDFAQKNCCRKVYNKMFLEPGNQYSGYAQTPQMNLPKLIADSIYNVKIEVKDFAGNTNVLGFKIKYHPLQSEVDESYSTPNYFRYSQSNFLKNENLYLNLPQGALYANAYVEYNHSEPCQNCLSLIHHVGSSEIPVHRYYNLKIKLNANYTGDKSKLAIASLKNGRIIDYEGGVWKNGFVEARTRQFGDFAIAVDTTAPRIRPINFKEGSSIGSLGRIKIKVTDDFSGIKKIDTYINNQWVLFEYDAKNNLIFAWLKDLELEAGVQNLKVVVQDDKKNVQTKTYHLKL